MHGCVSYLSGNQHEKVALVRVDRPDNIGPFGQPIGEFINFMYILQKPRSYHDHLPKRPSL